MIRLGLTCDDHLPEENGGVRWPVSRINDAYVRSVLGAGALPVLIPVVADRSALAELLALCDGLILTGGGDLSPSLYGQAPHPKTGPVSLGRDTCELQLFELAQERRLPLFGICRGMQLINVALGGTLHQHLDDCPSVFIRHLQEEDRTTAVHDIEVSAGSLIAQALGSHARVNSLHHQAVGELGAGLQVTARSPDGVIEAAETKQGGCSPIIAVQWHPEEMAERSPSMSGLFKLFVKLCESKESQTSSASRCSGGSTKGSDQSSS